ncbi:MAG TPA: ABC transporter ATP-binding protein [Burkholderiales bacterium]
MLLSLAQVKKTFGARCVLDDVSLELPARACVAVLGESGSGKSTLLNVIAGLEPVDSGSVRFEGRELTALDDDALTRLRRDAFGFVFQAFHVLPHLTVLANVGLPLVLRRLPAAQVEARARAALAGVGLEDRATAMPRELSGGELQRVAIARAVAGGPRLVLADEPTGNLDAGNAAQALRLLRDQVEASGAAMILATHSEAAAAACDRRYRLGPGGLTPLD